MLRVAKRPPGCRVDHIRSGEEFDAGELVLVVVEEPVAEESLPPDVADNARITFLVDQGESLFERCWGQPGGEHDDWVGSQEFDDPERVALDVIASDWALEQTRRGF